MSTKLVPLPDLCIGRFYKIIHFRNGINFNAINTGIIDNSDLDKLDKNTLGKLLEIKLQLNDHYARPSVILYFENYDGSRLEYEPIFGYSEAYIEYEPQHEQISRERIQNRTRILKNEIVDNDWALHPDNVLYTQDIDVSNFLEGRK